MRSDPTPRHVLSTAVEALGGQERAGQTAMAEAVAAALDSGTHLLVQAGTGTGKSLAYLVPALLHGERVVVATATLALQHQLVERDLPALLEAVRDVAGLPKDAAAVLKGRSNYACLHRVRDGVPDDQGALIDAEAVAQGSLATEVLELRSWVEEQASDGGTGERDHAPRHGERAWRQVSVGHRECLGATRCPFGQECFAELARERAHQARLVVTNHSLLAIDAIEGVPMLPAYDAVVVDEAHELVARVTQAATDELSVGDVERTAMRADRHVAERDGASSAADALAEASDALLDALAAAPAGRLSPPPEQLADALAQVRDAARSVVSALPKEGKDGPDPAVAQVKGWAQELFETAGRMAALSERDVLWAAERDRVRGGKVLHVAPLDVAGPMRDGLLAEKTVVMTSATLKLGGDFDAVAASLGLWPRERVAAGDVAPAPASAGEERPEGVQPWSALDVGSPFDYPRQGILYVARHLPPPGRDGLGQAQLDEITRLVDAADGRTLGLFSSRRAAQAAAEHVRKALPHLTTVAQGEAQLPELTRQFVEDPHTNLFGTLGLWQGLDVPGDTCSLVIIDRVPFPRPDDPLLSARQRAVDQRGGNGFMQVAATHAALLLAQGAGRLIRTTDDRGVVACLDPRLVSARYAGFLRASLPPMWQTQDGAVVVEALRRLAGNARAAGRAGGPGASACDHRG